MLDFPMFGVFLAHNSVDKPQVRAIAKELRKRGLNPWLDEEKIAPGQLFQDAIQKAIPQIKSAVICIGTEGLGKWEVLELQALISQFVNKGSPVIPVLLPGVDRIPDNLPFLQQFKWVSFERINDAKAFYELEWGITGVPPEDHNNKPVSSPIKSLSDLKEELISDSKLIDELKEIFPKEDKLFWRCAKQVYQDFLLQLNDKPELEEEPDNLDELLLQLKDWPEQTIVLEFVPRLVAYLLIKYQNEYSDFVGNLKEITNNKNIVRFKFTKNKFTKAVKKFQQEYEKVYLIISITKSQSHPDLFQIYGWLATDKIIENPHLDLTPLMNQDLGGEPEDDETKEQHYKLENLKKIVRGFLYQIGEKRKIIKKLIIEFFLPSSLFGWDVDKWDLEPPNKIYLGSVHEVRIRSLDRLRPNYELYLERWKNKWRLVQQCRNPLQRFFSSHFNFDNLVGKLQPEEIIGLKLKSALNSGHTGIASALYYSGTPIALWLRCDPQEGDCETELNQILQLDRLLNLPERVFKQRCQTKQHLCLLWDNPNRLIPNYQLS